MQQWCPFWQCFSLQCICTQPWPLFITEQDDPNNCYPKARNTLQSWHHLNTWNDGMTNSINADVMEMGLTRLQCRYRLHTADHCGKPYYPQYLPINVCYPSQWLVAWRSLFTWYCHFFVWPSGSLRGVVTPVYSQLQPGSQLLTDHMTTLLNYQRPWDHSLTGSCNIQSNITGIHPGLVTVPYTADVGVTFILSFNSPKISHYSHNLVPIVLI